MDGMTIRREVTDLDRAAAARLKAIYRQEKALRKHAGQPLTYEDVAEVIGKTPGAVSQFMNGTTAMNEGMCLKMARFFGVSPAAIDPRLADLLPNVTSGGKNVSELTNDNNVVPLISWAQAGSRWTPEGASTANDAEKWILCPINHSNQTFALRVQGSSMCNQGGSPSFDVGDIIHVDPEVPAKNDSLVVVRLDGEDEAIFRQLIIEGSRRFLKALNPAWPERIQPMPPGASVRGVVISKTVSYQ